VGNVQLVVCRLEDELEVFYLSMPRYPTYGVRSSRKRQGSADSFQFEGRVQKAARSRLDDGQPLQRHHELKLLPIDDHSTNIHYVPPRRFVARKPHEGKDSVVGKRKGVLSRRIFDSGSFRRGVVGMGARGSGRRPLGRVFGIHGEAGGQAGSMSRGRRKLAGFNLWTRIEPRRY
jgi:hypothetical protein